MLKFLLELNSTMFMGSIWKRPTLLGNASMRSLDKALHFISECKLTRIIANNKTINKSQTKHQLMVSSICGKEYQLMVSSICGRLATGLMFFLVNMKSYFKVSIS